jgi:formate-dependent nitrite reductase membrane component NrfD
MLIAFAQPTHSRIAFEAVVACTAILLASMCIRYDILNSGDAASVQCECGPSS